MIRPLKRHFFSLLLVLPALTYATSLQAQALRAGDGLLATYYEGENFERPVLSRRDLQLNFQWALASPAPGVPAEHFSVRWQGWLVPPASGRYILHLRVDDGVRVWLNGRQIVNEWRDQYFSDYTTAVELRAGEAYQLRIDYYQNALESRMRLAWERPASAPPVPAPPPSWRNLWGLNNPTPEREEVLSAAYLFTSNPRPVTQPSVAPRRPALAPPPPMRVTLSDVRVMAKPAAVSRSLVRQVPKATAKILLVKPSLPLPLPARQPEAQPGSTRPVIDSVRQLGTSDIAQLSENQSFMLTDLRFEQSQARLLPAARQALDGLATALRQRPTLRLEVQGHTDNQGSAELNHQLSQQRAEVVCLYLSAHGVAPSRLIAKGYGGTQPVADNNDPSQRPRNRRVVLVPQPPGK